MAVDDRFSIQTQRSTAFAAGIMELVAAALVLAQIIYLVGLLLSLVPRRKKP
jgi:hypothetical protein